MLGLLSLLLRADPARQGRAEQSRRNCPHHPDGGSVPSHPSRCVAIPLYRGGHGDVQRHPQRPRPAWPPPAAPPRARSEGGAAATFLPAASSPGAVERRRHRHRHRG